MNYKLDVRRTVFFRQKLPTILTRVFLLIFAGAGVFDLSMVAAGTIEIPSALLTIAESTEVSSARTGRLAKVYFHEGQLVKLGQLVAVLDDSKAKAACREARLELRIASEVANDDIALRYAQKTLDQAVSELKRSEEINQELANTVPERELEFLQLAVDQAGLEIERVKKTQIQDKMKVDLQQTALDIAKIELKEHQLYAPTQGMVVSVEKHAGERVESGTPILRIVRIDRIRAEGLLKAELASLKLIGQPTQLLVKAPDGSVIKVTGKVTFVSPEANPVNAMVRVWAEFDLTDSVLRPGLRGTLQISSPTNAD